MYRGKCFSKYNHLPNVRCWSSSTFTKNKQLTKSQRLVRSNTTSGRNSSSNSVYLGASVVTVGLIGVGATLYAKYDNDARKSMEANLPFLKPLFVSLYGDLQEKTNLLPVKKDLSTSSQLQNESGFFTEETPSKVLYDVDIQTNFSESAALNTLDIPGVSVIDLELSKRKKAANTEEEMKHRTFETPVIDDTLQQAMGKITGAGKKENNDLNDEKHTVSTFADSDEKVRQSAHLAENSSAPNPPTDIAGTDQGLLAEGPLSPDEIRLLSEVATSAAMEVFLEASAENLIVLLRNAKIAQHEAAESIRKYCKKLSDVVYVPSSDENYESSWKSASDLEHASQEIVDKAKMKAEEFKTGSFVVQELISSIRKAEGSSAVADEAEILLQSCDNDIKIADDDVEKAESELNFFLDFQKFVMDAPDKLRQDLEKFTPDLLALLASTNSEWKKLPTRDAILALALKRQIKSQDVNAEQRLSLKELDELLKNQKHELQEAADRKLAAEIERVGKEKAITQELKLKDLEQKHDLEMLLQLKRQASAHTIHLSEELENQAERLKSEHHNELKIKLDERKQIYKLELEKNLACIRGIQSKISDVVDVESKHRRIQELWLAAQALSSALEECLFHGRTRTLMPELLSIVHLEGNGVLQEIVETVPEAAAMFGVVPEKELKQRFKHVKKVCKKVALIDEQGGGIGTYLISYVKSFIVYSGWYQRNVDESIDLENLGPYEILSKAEYYINEGDLEQAAKFMSQLKGAARKMSTDWLNEVRMLLETKQTANLLLAYAASLHSGVDFQQKS